MSKAVCCRILFEARKRGVLFDVGHGGAAFEFRQAVPAVRQGFPPDSISTDVHSGSINSGMKDQLNVMSKFLNMGMSLDDVIYRSTWNPARIIHREQLGHLSVGAPLPISPFCAWKRANSRLWTHTVRAWTATSVWSANLR